MWTEITDFEWEGLAGAESFQDGSRPLINNTFTVDGLDAVAIVDGTIGLAIEAMTPDGEPVSLFTLEGPLATRWVALQEAAALTTTDLLAAGFAQEDLRP